PARSYYSFPSYRLQRSPRSWSVAGRCWSCFQPPIEIRFQQSDRVLTKLPELWIAAFFLHAATAALAETIVLLQLFLTDDLLWFVEVIIGQQFAVGYLYPRLIEANQHVHAVVDGIKVGFQALHPRLDLCE